MSIFCLFFFGGGGIEIFWQLTLQSKIGFIDSKMNSKIQIFLFSCKDCNCLVRVFRLTYNDEEQEKLIGCDQ